MSKFSGFSPSFGSFKKSMNYREGEKCVRVVFLERRQPLLLSGNNILLLVFPDMTDKGHVVPSSNAESHIQRDRTIQQVTKGQKGQIMRWPRS